MITVSKKTLMEQIKPLHSVGGGPRQGGAYLGYDFWKEYMEIGIPYSRLHDIEGAYAQNQFVDIHCVFPNFDADVDNPASYNFTMTDRYVKAIHDCGGQAFYRLGETIDHYPNPLYIHKPKDNLKWAKICERIIMHYNHGWADGFELGIKYWEIWNEPDNHRMWTGTNEDFYELYVVAATHLKKKFPNLKIGGYGASGFYAFNRADASDWFKTLPPFLTGFFEYLKKQSERVPLDFLSWHCYSESPEEVVLHSNIARDFLIKYGYEDAESILDEYNTRDSLSIFPKTLPYYGAEIASTLIAAQDSTIDKLMYYDIRLISMNGIFQITDYKNIERLHAFYALKYFGNLYRLKTRCECVGAPKNVYVLSATDGEKLGIMISAKDFSGEITVKLDGLTEGKYTLNYSTYQNYETTTVNDFNDGIIKINLEKDSFCYIEI